MKAAQIALLCSVAIFASPMIGEKCPENYERIKTFDNGGYLLRIDENTTIECVTPKNTDTLLYFIGINKQVNYRVSGVRHFKYNSSKYNVKDIRSIFSTSLNNCTQRTDGLFECYSKDNRYSSISESKNEFAYVSQDLLPFNITYGFNTKELDQHLLFPLGEGLNYYFLNKTWDNPVIPQFIIKAKLQEIQNPQSLSGIGPYQGYERRRLINDYIAFQQNLESYISDSVPRFIAFHRSEFPKSKDDLDSAFVKKVIADIVQDSLRLISVAKNTDSVMRYTASMAIDSICNESKATANKPRYASANTFFCDGDYKNGLIGYFTNANLAAFVDSQIYVPIYGITRTNDDNGMLARTDVFISKDGKINIRNHQGIIKWTYSSYNNCLFISEGTTWNRLAQILNSPDTSARNRGPILDIIKYWYTSFAHDENPLDYRTASLGGINTSTDYIWGPGNGYLIHDKNLMKNIIYSYREQVENLFKKSPSKIPPEIKKSKKKKK